VIGDRKRHRDLAIVRLAQPPAILPRDADGVNALFRKAGVIDDPRGDAALRFERRRDEVPDLVQNRLIRLGRLAHQVQKRLMFRRNARRRHHRSDRLDALALAGHQQARAIISERLGAILTPQNSRQRIDIRNKTRFTRLRFGLHRRHPPPVSRFGSIAKLRRPRIRENRDSVELERDMFPRNRIVLWILCFRMIFSKNRFPLFGIML
jgi:hypothetical protein